MIAGVGGAGQFHDNYGQKIRALPHSSSIVINVWQSALPKSSQFLNVYQVVFVLKVCM